MTDDAEKTNPEHTLPPESAPRTTEDRLHAIEASLSDLHDKTDRLLNVCMALADDQLGTRARVELLESTMPPNGGE